MNKINYRPEIDGLRTIAVFLVILYHTKLLFANNGFIGVDIFLVISGYLITKIIILSYEKNNFSFIAFYVRRIKRIIPLTYFILTLILITGYFISYPLMYYNESISTLSILAFLSNIRFALQDNYFSNADNNPLIHMWSLSLEEQFYFVWPLFIGILYKFKQSKKIILSTIILLITSLALATFFISVPTLKQYAYYILPTRMTGLLIGIVIAIINPSISKNINHNKMTANLVSLSGFVLIAISLLIINKDNFPGITMLPACIGSALIILSPNASITKILLTNKPATFLGKISFSLYMWHWPLLVFTHRYFLINELHFRKIYFLPYFIILIVLSILSYYFIENFFRRIKTSNLKIIIFMLILPLTLIGTYSLYVYTSDGIISRYDIISQKVDFKAVTRQTTGCYETYTSTPCYINQDKHNKSNILLIGNSHAGSLSNFVQKMAIDNKLNALEMAAGSCMPFEKKEIYNPRCTIINKGIRITLKKETHKKINISYILLSIRYDNLPPELFKHELLYIKELSSKGYKIILPTQPPRLMENKYKDINFRYSYFTHKTPTFATKVNSKFMQYNQQLQELSTKDPNILVINVTSFFVNDKGEYRILDDNGASLYFDDDHLSAYGAEWLYDKLKNSPQGIQLRKFLAQ